MFDIAVFGNFLLELLDFRTEDKILTFQYFVDSGFDFFFLRSNFNAFVHYFDNGFYLG